ncbi:MAG: DMT family transporter [Rubrivivax sp.]|nr:DMT family transporter [Rubrivivax sp.]
MSAGATSGVPGSGAPLPVAPAAGVQLTRRQLVVLVLLTLTWGINWPIMKVGVSGLPAEPSPYPPLTFRALSMLLGLPVLWVAVRSLKVPLAIPRAHWPEVARLLGPNMLVWHVVIIFGVQALSSGRSAILGYTMPVFVALVGAFFYGERLAGRQWSGVAAAALGVVLLLWEEFARMAGAPWAAAAVVGAAAVWALGTHMLRRSTIPVPLLAVVFWMTVACAVVLTLLAVLFERSQWRWPEPHVTGAVLFNAAVVFGFSQAAWLYLARTLPPVASSISVMMIPVLGVFSGALFLGEVLHWQDWAAVVLMVAAIWLVLRAR